MFHNFVFHKFLLTRFIKNRRLIRISFAGQNKNYEQKRKTKHTHQSKHNIKVTKNQCVQTPNFEEKEKKRR